MIPVGDEGFPGTWFIENRSTEARTHSAERLTASYLRLLKKLSAAVASQYPGRRMSGRLIVSDRSWEACAGSVSVAADREVDLFLEIPWRTLFEEPKTQERAIRGLVSNQASLRSWKDHAAPTAEAASPCEGGLVQFIHCASLFEERERRYSSIPPAAFFMAPALRQEGFQLAVDPLIVEPFAEPSLSPGRIREDNRERLDQILERRPFCIAVTAMDFYLEELRCLVKEIRDRDREVLIAVGGPMMTLYPEKAPVYLEEGNVFIRGEADTAFSEVLASLRALHAGRDLSGRESSLLKDTAGLFLRFGDTVHVSNLDRGNRIESLDHVFREAVDLGFVEKQHIRGGLNLHATRGCPFQCSFCAKVHGSAVRAMASETILRLLSAYEKRIDEIQHTEGLSETEREQALQVSFSDDDFLLSRPRARAFFLGFGDHSFQLKTVPAGIPSFLSRGEDGGRTFDPGLFDALASARTRIRSFEIGTDDVSERELSRLAKGDPAGYTLRDIEEVVSRLEQLGIPNRHFMILSNPDTEWSDLFEKLITLEALSWSYPHFYPDPNPFVLAPMGTPLFSQLVKQGRADVLGKKILAVPGFPEFTHWIFNMAPPREELFSTDRLSRHGFFRKLCDLLKTRYRFSIFDDAYLHFLDVCNSGDLLQTETGERERILDQITRAVRLRAERIVSHIERESPLSKDSTDAWRLGSWGQMLCGLFLLRETIGAVFRGPALQGKREELGERVDEIHSRLETCASSQAHLPEWFRRQVRQALDFGADQVRLYRAGGCTNRTKPLPNGFMREIDRRLLNMGLQSEAEAWRGLCARSADLVRLEVTDDRKDARFVEDAGMTKRLFEIPAIADPGLPRLEEGLRFLRAELVLRTSIRDDFLSHADTRVTLYDRLAVLPLDFIHRFQQEFDVSPFLDKEEFVTVLLSKFLAARERTHSREMHGTLLFDGFEDALEELVPRSLEEFSTWFFGKA